MLPNVVCGATIGGNLDVHSNKNTSIVGVSSPACSAGNSIGGDLHVNDNKVASGGSAVVSGNTVGHNLDCHGNTPAPTGGGNTVSGHKTGQCSGF